MSSWACFKDTWPAPVFILEKWENAFAFYNPKIGTWWQFFKKARASAPRLQDKLDFENNSKIYIPTDYT